MMRRIFFLTLVFIAACGTTADESESCSATSACEAGWACIDTGLRCARGPCDAWACAQLCETDADCGEGIACGSFRSVEQDDLRACR